MSTILVTGCMGFIGSNLVPKLLRAGHKVVGFDNLSNASINPTDRMKKESGKYWGNFKFLKLDVRDSDILKTIGLSERIESIIHLAALGSVSRSFQIPMDYVRNNEMGFVSVMEMARQFAIPVVYASSSSVYGDHKDAIRVEGNEGDPMSPYALSKRANEMFAKCWGKAAPVNSIGLRFFNVYGPGQLPDSAFSAVIPRFLTAKKLVVFGDGSATRDYTYVEDVCQAICNARAFLSVAADLKRQLIEVFNVGTGKATTIAELLTYIGREADATFKPERPGDVKVSVASTKKAEEILKFTATTSIESGLIKTLSYYRSVSLAWKDANGEASQPNR